MELNEKQKQIVETDKSKVVVLASAASGKTKTLVSRLKYLLDSGIEPRKIVAITFTNAAAEEISKRVGEKGKNCFIGTVHGYCRYLLGVKGISTSDIIEEEEFDKLFERFHMHPWCRPVVKHLLLDEAQDSTKQQIDFLLNDIMPDNWMFFGDIRQSIYGFSGADPQQLAKLSRRIDVTTYSLDYNYRCGQEIVNFAKGFIRKDGYPDNSISLTPYIGQVSQLTFTFPHLSNIIKSKDSYKDWFFLLRTNKELENVVNELKKAGIPYDTFRRAELDSADFLKIMNRDTVKVLTIHTAKGLEAKNVMVYGARMYNPEERRIAYVAATRAKENLYWLTKDKSKSKEKMVKWE